MTMTRLNIAAAWLLTLGGFGLAWGADPPGPASQPATGAAGSVKNGAPVKTDLYGDPLPTGVIGRLGTLRFWSQDGFACVVFSPDGKTLASASGYYTQTIRLWEAASGREIHTLKGHQSQVMSLAFAPDGKTLASASDDKTIRLWDLQTGKDIRQLLGHRAQVRSVAFAPDGKTLVSASLDDTVRLWDVATGQEIRRLLGPTWTFHYYSVAFSPDGKTLALGCPEKKWSKWKVRLYEVATGKERHQFPGDLHAFAPDGQTLAAAVPGTKTIHLWNVATGQEIRQFQGHQFVVTAITFAPGGKTLASGSEQAIRLWDVATAKEIGRFHAQVASFAFAPDGKTLVSGANAVGRLYEWDVATGQEIGRFRGHHAQVGALAFAPDGKTLTSVGNDNTVRVWELATSKELHQPERQKATAITAADASPDGTIRVSKDENGAIQLWDTITKKPCRQFLGHNGGVRAVAFAPDGKTLASISYDDTARLWEVATGKKIRQFQGHKSAVSSVAISPDGKTLATGSYDTTILLWDLSGPPQATARPEKLDAKELETLWAGLADRDATTAYQALWTLAAAPRQAVPFLQKQLPPRSPAPDQKLLTRLIADLDNADFTTREQAALDLEGLADGAEPALRQALAGKPSPEVRTRAERVLKRIVAGQRIYHSPAQLRWLRAIQVLEQVATPEARQVLATLAQGAEGSRITQEARAADKRLARRPVAAP